MKYMPYYASMAWTVPNINTGAKKLTLASRSEEDVKFSSGIVIHAVLLQARIEGNKSILGTDVEIVVDLPVHLPHFASWVPQPLHAAHTHPSLTPHMRTPPREHNFT